MYEMIKQDFQVELRNLAKELKALGYYSNEEGIYDFQDVRITRYHLLAILRESISFLKYRGVMKDEDCVDYVVGILDESNC